VRPSAAEPIDEACAEVVHAWVVPGQTRVADVNPAEFDRHAGENRPADHRFGLEQESGAEVQPVRTALERIGVAILGGVAVSYSPIDPIKALFWSAVVNGVVAVPLMAIIMLLVSRKSLMGVFVATPWQRWGGWAATAVMGVAAVLMFVTM